MTELACHGCGKPLVKNWTGRDPKWCSGRCRKASYGQPCIDCGARTSHGAEGRRVAEPRCRQCTDQHSVVWTPAAIVAAIQAWAREHGQPPAICDWNPTQARHYLHDEDRAARFEDAGGRWPHSNTVYRAFGSWNAALRTAGYSPRRVGGFPENRRHRSAA